MSVEKEKHALRKRKLANRMLAFRYLVFIHAYDSFCAIYS